MPQWITDIQGVTTIKNAAGVAQPRRHVIKITGVTTNDDGTQTVINLGPATVAGAPTPTATQIYNALKLLGIFA